MKFSYESSKTTHPISEDIKCKLETFRIGVGVSSYSKFNTTSVSGVGFICPGHTNWTKDPGTQGFWKCTDREGVDP